MGRLDRKILSLCVANAERLNSINRAAGRSDYQEIFGTRFIPPIIRSIKVLSIIYVCLFVFAFPALMLFFLAKSLWGIIKEKHGTFQGERLFLLSTIALPRVVKNAGLYNESDYWLLLPWTDNSEIPRNKKLSVFSLLTVKDVIDAYYDSVITIWSLFIERGYKYPLFAVKSILWFLYLKAIRHINNNVELVFANHKDEYAVLIESLNHNKKVLIQHGTEIVTQNPNKLASPLYNYIEDYNFWTNNMPARYSTVSEVYAFSNKEIIALRSSILNCDPKFTIVGYNLKSFNYNIEGEKAILVIGYYDLYYQLEEKVIAMLQDTGLKIYLKNHPLFLPCVYGDLRHKYNFELLNGSVFPKVDLVLSYDSTLALEYDALGAKVIYYNNMDELTLNEVLRFEVARINGR